MLKLLLLYWGTTLLMYLSHRTNPSHPRRLPSSLRYPKADLFVLLAIAWMTCFCFLRTNYNDTAAYVNGFRAAPSPSEFLASGQLWDLTGNPLFYFYESLIRSITGNYHIFFFPVSFLSCYSAVKLFYRYSASPALSLLIYYSVGTFMLFMAAMKQCVAASLLVLSIPYAIDRKYVRFYLLVGLASLFHTYAILFAIVPLLFGKPWGLRTYILLLASIFSLLTFQSTLGAFLDYAQSVGAHAAEDDLFDGHAVNALRVAVYLVPGILAFLFRERLFADSSRAENLFVNLSILSGLILMIGLAQGANLMARMAGFFEIGSAVCLPWMIQKIFNRRSARLVTQIAVVMYFGYFLYEFTISKNFAGDYASTTLLKFLLGLLQ